MQLRFHLVECEGENCSGSCPNCIDNLALKEIYANQLTILMSLDDEGTYSLFNSSESYFNGCKDAHKGFFKEMLETGEEPIAPSAEARSGASRASKRNKFEIDSKSKLFIEPLVRERKSIGNRSVMVSKSLWNDKYVNFEALRAEDKDFNGVSDGFIHRQFTICTRGWSVFGNLLPNGADKIAQDLFNQKFPSKILNNPSDQNLAALLINDSSMSFFSISDDLKGFIGKERKRLGMDNFLRNNWHNFGPDS